MKRWIFLSLEIWRKEGLLTLLTKLINRFSNFANYKKWMENNEPDAEKLARQRTLVDNFDYKPLISMVIPIWNAPKNILDQTISSVIQQTYENWELCIAAGASQPETRNLLAGWAKKDGRIKVKYLEKNLGISLNSNEALAMAQGEFVGFLDHDDLLAPFALFEIVQQLQINQMIDVIYSDEDKLRNGRRFEPFFKPGFSPDYLRSTNYMPHFLVVRRSLGDQVGWFRVGLDGAQDYDFILRLVEKTQNIVHIPKVLYHWRVWGSSTASSSQAKPYADAAGKKALQEHLGRVGISAVVEEGHMPTWHRIQYELPATPLVSIIIPNQDHAKNLKLCTDSILHKTTYPHFEIVIAENGSKEKETFQVYENIQQHQNLQVLTWKSPFNYSSINNWAVEHAQGELLLFLNNDTQIINRDWLEQMLQFGLRSDVGAVGAKLYYADGTIQHGGIVLGIGGIAGHAHKYFPKQHSGYFGQLVLPRNVSAVTGACLMIRKQVFQEVDGFDDGYPIAYGDIDLCLRVMENGYMNVWTPYAELYHFESKTRGYKNADREANQEADRFKEKWASILAQGDPYYNPNLTLTSEGFGINPGPAQVTARTLPRNPSQVAPGT